MFDKEQIRYHTSQIDLHNQAIKDMLDEDAPPPDSVLVDSTEKLEAALIEGGNIVISAGSELRGNFKFSSPAIIHGQESVTLIGDGRPALDVPLGVHDTGMENLQLRVGRYEVVFLMGRNDTTQVDPNDVPRRVKVNKLFVAGHRGKRVVEVNAADVIISDCEIRDSYDPERLDSQGILIMNTPGNIAVSDCHIEGGSENVMVGGDTMKLVNTRPTNILFESCIITKPMNWKAEGIPVKNLFELKDGHDVTVRNCKFSNCWVSAQNGYCFVFTPRQGGTVRNVLIENCTVENVSGIVNIMGFDDNYRDLPRVTCRFQGGTFKTNRSEMGGHGHFALITNGPESVVIDGIDCQHTGNSFLGIEDKDSVDQLHILNSRWNYGQYGIRIGGYSDGDNQLGIVKDLKIEGNTILGANARFKTRYPNNTFQ